MTFRRGESCNLSLSLSLSLKRARVSRAAIEALESRTLLAAVTNAVFDFNTAPNELRVTFDTNYQSLLTADMLRLDDVTHDTQVNVSLIGYNTQTNTATFRFPNAQGSRTNVAGVLPDAWYRASISTDDLPLGQNWVKDFSMRCGDTDGNGVINFDDYARIDLGFSQHFTGFTNGDFDYNGIVNFDDYALIDLAFGTTLLQPPTGPNTLNASGVSTSEVQLNWDNSAVSGEQGWRIQYSSDGQNFTTYWSVTGHVNNFTADHALLDGSKYFWRVRAFGNGQDTAYTPKKSAITVLANPTLDEDVYVTGKTATVRWINKSATATGFKVQLLFGKSVIATYDVGASGTSYTFSNLELRTDYRVKVEAINGLNPTPNWVSGAVEFNSGEFVPNSTWTWAYGDLGAGEGVTANWDPELPPYGGPLGDESVKLDLYGLPRHTYISYYFQLGGTGFGTGMSVSVAGSQVANLAGQGGSWYIGSDANDTAVLPHTDSSVRVEFNASGFEGNSTTQGWYVARVWVRAYLPVVSLVGGGTAVEDGSGDGFFTVSRTGGSEVLGHRSRCS